MKKLHWGIASLITACLFSCNSKPEFCVKGDVINGQGETIYLVASKQQGPILVDSTIIDANNTFTFNAQSTNAPEFYRLQTKSNQIINFVVDSTETIRIQTDYNTFGGDYKITPTKNNQEIKALTHLQMNLQQQMNKLNQKAKTKHLGTFIYQEEMNKLISAYKENIRRNYIFKAPNTLFAYFALFQSANGYTLFNALNSKQDAKCFGAVATSFSYKYPNSSRAKSLTSITLQGLQKMRIANRQAEAAKAQRKNSSKIKIEETGIINLKLKDRDGVFHQLTDLKGKTVLLDFTVYESNNSTPHNFMLRDLYDKYAAKGFEIYQVSLDNDLHFWKTITDKLPWITVHDPHGIYSTNLKLYNVKNIPSLHLINKENEYVKHITDLKTLEKEIKKQL